MALCDPKPALGDRPLSGAVADEPLDPTCGFDLQPRIQHARMTPVAYWMDAPGLGASRSEFPPQRWNLPASLVQAAGEAVPC
jgi:hypothetical protein